MAITTTRRNQELVDQWCRRFVALLDSLPNSSEHNGFRSHRYELIGLYADGTVTGKSSSYGYGYGYRENTESCQVLASIGEPMPRVFCTCEAYKRNSACVHAVEFVDWFIDEIARRNSKPQNRLVMGKWTNGVPDSKVFPTEEREIVLSMLAKMPDLKTEDDDASLPDHNVAPPTRLLWDFVYGESGFKVTPVLQKKKKRGNGWTKGRRMRADTFRAHQGQLSPADEVIRNGMYLDDGYNGYSQHWVLPVDIAMRELKGSPNVLIDGQPGEIVDFAAKLCVREHDDRLTIQLAGTQQGDSILGIPDGLARYTPSKHRIELAKMPTAHVEAVFELLRFPPVPIKFHDDFIDRVSDLADSLPIDLPGGLDGERVRDECSPVMLLRSNTDGTLDYGIRVRSQSGKLYAPASGRFSTRCEIDGKKVRLQRDYDKELKMAVDLAEALKLPDRKLQGTLNDFEFTMQLLEQLETSDLGVEVLWDKKTSEPMRMLGAITPNNVSVGITQKRDWFQLEGKCELGNETLELAELLQGLSDGSPDIRGDFVRIGSKGWARIAPKLRKQLAALRDSVVTERKKIRFDATSAPAIREMMEHDFQLKASRAWHKCLKRLDAAEKLDPQPPAGLNAELRCYQTEGYAWLRRLAEWGVGGILADDMGLGKTLQTLAVLLDRAETGPCLVIAPTSVGFNWIRETEKFTPSLDAHLYRDTDRNEFIKQLSSGELGPGQIVVCSYGLALRDIEQLQSVQWGTLVLDEAQAVKNSRSKTSLAIAQLTAEWKVALTGTPVENHLGELWSLFHVISPGVFGGWEQFRTRFAAPIEKDGDADRQKALGDRLKPFVLRRTKAAVLTDLPPRTESTITVELSAAERKMYDKVRLSVLGEMDQIAKLDDVQDQRFRILALLTRMRQLACSPKLVDDSWTERSSKLEELQKLVSSLKEEGHRVLVFSQFVKHLQLIREMFDEEQTSYEYLDGQTAASKRQECVDRFQNGDATAFLISLKAGGTGLNLTAADYVIHMDPWWNPAVEDQATDRAHRIGQDKPVMVYRLIAQHTIEDEILRLHETKRDLVEGVMAGTQAAAKLSTQDLINLVKDGAK